MLVSTLFTELRTTAGFQLVFGSLRRTVFASSVCYITISNSTSAEGARGRGSYQSDGTGVFGSAMSACIKRCDCQIMKSFGKSNSRWERGCGEYAD